MLPLLSNAGIAVRSLMGGGTLPVLAVTALMAVAGVAYSKGAQGQQEQVAALEAQVSSLNDALDHTRAQIASASAAQIAANTRTEQDAARFRQTQEDADAFIHSLSSDTCVLDPDDAERLRGIGY